MASNRDPIAWKSAQHITAAATAAVLSAWETARALPLTPFIKWQLLKIQLQKKNYSKPPVFAKILVRCNASKNANCPVSFCLDRVLSLLCASTSKTAINIAVQIVTELTSG